MNEVFVCTNCDLLVEIKLSMKFSFVLFGLAGSLGEKLNKWVFFLRLVLLLLLFRCDRLDRGPSISQDFYRPERLWVGFYWCLGVKVS
jgi:hypothetical protein